MATLEERAREVVTSYEELERDRLNLEAAQARYDFTKRQVMLARDRYRSEWDFPTSLFDFPDHIEIDRQEAGHFVWVMNRIRFMGLPIGQACRIALGELKLSTTEALVSTLEDGGFSFSTTSPSREIHAALMKQPWVKRSPGGEWEYVGT